MKGWLRVVLFTIIPFIILVVIIAGSYGVNKSISPWIEYHNSTWSFDTDNLLIYNRKGYILNQSHSYDTVDTDSGYDLILHFEKEQR